MYRKPISQGFFDGIFLSHNVKTVPQFWLHQLALSDYLLTEYL